MAFRPKGWEPNPVEYLRAIHSTDPKELTALAASSNEFVRARVAANVHSPRSVLATLAEDEDPAVCASAVGNKNPNKGGDIVLLACYRGLWKKDAYWQLRSVLASSWFTPESVIRELHQRGELSLQLLIVERKYCNPALLREYAEWQYHPLPDSEDDRVRQRIRAIARRKLEITLPNNGKE